MEREKITELFKKYELTKSDYFQHKHYEIITRQGIDKIQAKEKIFINYEAIRCEPEFCVIKAKAKKDNAIIETFGSAKYGGKEWNKDRNNGKGGWDEHGNATTWYIAEMAEKRAMSRAVLKLTGFYELGVFGEDESEDFKRPKTTEKPQLKEASKIESKKDILDITSEKSIQKAIDGCKTIAKLNGLWKANIELQKGSPIFVQLITKRKKVLIDNGITE